MIYNLDNMREAEKFPEFREHLTSKEVLDLSRKATDEAKEKARELIERARALDQNEN